MKGALCAALLLICAAAVVDVASGVQPPEILKCKPEEASRLKAAWDFMFLPAGGAKETRLETYVARFPLTPDDYDQQILGPDLERVKPVLQSTLALMRNRNTKLRIECMQADDWATAPKAVQQIEMLLDRKPQKKKNKFVAFFRRARKGKSAEAGVLQVEDNADEAPKWQTARCGAIDGAEVMSAGASANREERDIVVCPSFWHSQENLKKSMMGKDPAKPRATEAEVQDMQTVFTAASLFHEFTHIAADTFDHAYGYDAVAALDPKRKPMNADSYTLWFRSQTAWDRRLQLEQEEALAQK